MTPDKIAYLLMMARDARADGDDLVREQTKINTAHAHRLRELWEMAEETRTILQQEMHRFSRYFPKTELDDQGGARTLSQTLAKKLVQDIKNGEVEK